LSAENIRGECRNADAILNSDQLWSTCCCKDHTCDVCYALLAVGDWLAHTGYSASTSEKQTIIHDLCPECYAMEVDKVGKVAKDEADDSTKWQRLEGWAVVLVEPNGSDEEAEVADSEAKARAKPSPSRSGGAAAVTPPARTRDIRENGESRAPHVPGSNPASPRCERGWLHCSKPRQAGDGHGLPKLAAGWWKKLKCAPPPKLNRQCPR
jgi:hypothetical protein